MKTSALIQKTAMRILQTAAVIILITVICPGCIYVNIRSPYDDNLRNTDLGSKKGVASAYSILWLVSWGDAGYAAAAKNGNIHILKHADQEIQSYAFGIFNRWSIIVYGD